MPMPLTACPVKIIYPAQYYQKLNMRDAAGRHMSGSRERVAPSRHINCLGRDKAVTASNNKNMMSERQKRHRWNSMFHLFPQSLIRLPHIINFSLDKQ